MRGLLPPAAKRTASGPPAPCCIALGAMWTSASADRGTSPAVLQRNAVVGGARERAGGRRRCQTSRWSRWWAWERVRALLEPHAAEISSGVMLRHRGLRASSRPLPALCGPIRQIVVTMEARSVRATKRKALEWAEQPEAEELSESEASEASEPAEPDYSDDEDSSERWGRGASGGAAGRGGCEDLGRGSWSSPGPAVAAGGSARPGRTPIGARGRPERPPLP